MPEAEQDSSSDTLTQTGSSFQNEIWKIWTLPMAVFRSLLVSESWGAGGGAAGEGHLSPAPGSERRGVIHPAGTDSHHKLSPQEAGRSQAAKLCGLFLWVKV